MLTLTAVVAAGKIKEDDGLLIMSQEFTASQAKFLAETLAVATNGPVYVRWIGVGDSRHYHVTPNDIKWREQDGQLS